MAKPKESKPLFTCHDAILKLCLRSRRSLKPILDEFHPVLNTYFLTLVMDDCYKAISLIFMCGIRLCILEQDNSKAHEIVLDTRFLESNMWKPGAMTVYWIIKRNTHTFLAEYINIKRLPKLRLHSVKRKGLSASLWDILPLQHLHRRNIPEPQTLQDFRTLVKRFGFENQCHVFFLARLIPSIQVVWYMGKTESTIAEFTFYAYTKTDYSLGFAFQQPKALTHHNIFVSQRDRQMSLPDPTTLNRRMSVSIALTGLTLAHHLGCCTLEEMTRLSQALASCVGALWATLDDESHVRHLHFQCNKLRCNRIALYCRQEKKYTDINETRLKDLMTSVGASVHLMKSKKTEILQTVLDRLLPFTKSSDYRNLWSRCHRQLNKTINTLKVLIFSPGDEELHFLKTAIASSFCKQKKSLTKLVYLSDNTLSAIQTKNVQFINLFHYFNHQPQKLDPWKDDLVLWEVVRGWLPPSQDDSYSSWPNPCLKHSISELRNQKPNFKDNTMIAYLIERAERNAAIIARLWEALVAFCVKHFEYDLSSKEHCSMGYLSFQIVWLQYAKKVGPLGHAIENMHPYAEHLLRPFCQGGFSYSRQTFLQQGQPLPTAHSSSQKASTIAEYDLTSAYGYSGTSMAAPKGFALIFGEGMKTQRRYTLFEYRAVMYTLWKWTSQQRRKIKSVFSNYSHLGLFSVGRHAIDLVAIFEDGQVEFVQMDGHYCHGHYDVPECPSLPGYINGKSRSECEERTRNRDLFIRSWIADTQQTAKICYSVYTDCCHPEYHPRVLAEAFQTIRPLCDLVKGLDAIDGSLDNLNLNNVTFLAIVNCHIPKPTGADPTFQPIFNFNEQEKVLLTSDYYSYLQKHHQVQITKIHWIAFYKRCFILPTIFHRLVGMRSPSNKPQSSFIKTIVNCACGFFGLNRNKSARKFISITPFIPRRFNQSMYAATPLEHFQNKELYLVERFAQRKTLAISMTPLPLFIGIIEFGKCRLNAIIQVLHEHLVPGSFSILYSNVDNLIVACSKEDFEEVLLDRSPDGLLRFQLEWLPLLANEPGCLKLEWKKGPSDDWQFVTPFCMFYVLKSNGSQQDTEAIQHKGIAKELQQNSFDIALSILRKEPTCIQLQKRVNKILNQAKQTVTQHF